MMAETSEESKVELTGGTETSEIPEAVKGGELEEVEEDDKIKDEEQKKNMALELCLKERAELENENDSLTRRIRALKEEEGYLDQILSNLLDLSKIVADMKQKNLELAAEVESRAHMLSIEEDGLDSCRECSDDENGDGEWDEEEEEKKEKSENEVEIIRVDDDLSLIRQFDPSLAKSVTTVKNGTLEKLVLCLYYGKGHDIPNYVDTFLLTYRSFMTPKLLLESLISAFPLNSTVAAPPPTSPPQQASNLPPSDLVDDSNDQDEHNQTRLRARIINFLRKWISSSPSDFFENDKELLQICEGWLASEVFTGESEKLGAFMKSGIKKAVEGQNSVGVAVFSQPPPNPVRPKKASFTILDLDPGELARQLTIVCSKLYSSIHSWEFLGQSWNKKEKDLTAPGITKLTNRFNLMSRWIGTQVVTEMNIRKRAQILEFFIRVGEELNELNNFHGIMEIISGLQSSGVFRLKKTWDLVSKKKISSLQRLGSYLSREASYKAYRETLHSRHPPIIPYIGVYLSDLTFLEDGNANFTENNHVNFHKRIMISNVIKEIKQYQQMPYNLEDVDVIQKYVEETMNIGLSENQIYEYSLKCEARTVPQKA